MPRDTSKDTQEKAELVILSRPDSHLIPLRANNRGQYVTTDAGKFMVSLKAVFRSDWVPSFPGKLKESEVIFSRFVYIGTLYPDGSSLPFIPVGNAEITEVENYCSSYEDRQRRNRFVESSNSNDLDSSFKAKVSIPLAIWSDMKRRFDSSLAWFSQFNVKYEVKEATNQGFISCHVEADREVTVCLNGIWFTKRLKEAVKGNGKLRGNIFLMPKLTRSPASDTVELSFEIYGMWVTDDLEKLFGPFHWQKVIY